MYIHFSLSPPATSEMHGFGDFPFWGHLRCLIPHQPSAEDASEAGAGGEHSPALPFQQDSRPVSGPGGGTRGKERLPGPAGERSGAAEGSLSLSLGAGQPNRAVRWGAWAGSVLPQRQHRLPDPVRDALGPGRSEMSARPQSRLCLRREPLGAIPTATQARPPSQTPPLLPAPPLPPGGRRGSETVRV